MGTEKDSKINEPIATAIVEGETSTKNKAEQNIDTPIQPDLLQPEGSIEANRQHPEIENSDTPPTDREYKQSKQHNNKKFKKLGNSDNKKHKDDHQYRDKTAPSLNLSELQSKSMHDLTKMGDPLKIEGIGALDKPELIFEILKANAEKNGLMYGSGYLEILPDGFGFLRSANYSYLPCPEDIA